MNKKKLLISFACILLFVMVLLVLKPWGTKPFKALSPKEITSAEIFLIPPEQTFYLTDAEQILTLCEVLQGLVIYQEDDSGREYNGQLVQATITLQDGTTRTIGAYGTFLFLDGTCYRTKYEPSQKMNAFGNGLRYND